MAQEVPPKRAFQDEWGDTRVGYEDRSAYRPKHERTGSGGNKFLGSVGSLLIVAGILWGTYLFTSGKMETSRLWQFPGPVHICVAGLIISIISKLLR